MTEILAGIDIGGTKCAVTLGELAGPNIRIVAKRRFATGSPAMTISQFLDDLGELLAERKMDAPLAIGISCGGPLDSRRGLILSPPNLPGWDAIDVITPFQQRFGVAVGLQNDANASALAEWRWGAGQGCHNVIFLTFGTGMGAGLILNGRLYYGASDMAGEVGHIRLEEDGPIGHGKAGSFEGFCSGSGIAQLAARRAEEEMAMGHTGPTYCPTAADLPDVTAEKVGRAAQQGDAVAREVYEVVARKLGKGLAILIDILNPERIVIGSIYGRQRSILEPITLGVIEREALPQAFAACHIVPAGLTENIGDYASLSVAYDLIKGKDV